MTFTDEQIKEIEELAGLNYTVKKIAMFLNVHPGELQAEFINPDSSFRYHYDRGRLFSQAKIDMALQTAAVGQNMTAIQQLEKIRALRHFENQRDLLLSDGI